MAAGEEVVAAAPPEDEAVDAASVDEAADAADGEFFYSRNASCHKGYLFRGACCLELNQFRFLM